MRRIESWVTARMDSDVDVPAAVGFYIGRRSTYALFYFDSQLEPSAIPVPRVKYMPGNNVVSADFTTNEVALEGLSGYRIGDDLQLQVNAAGHVLGIDIFHANTYLSPRQINRLVRSRDLKPKGPL